MGRIMLVDDKPDLCELVETVLGRNNHRVTSVYSGESALKRLEREKPDLLLLDIELPDIEGWKVLKRLSERSTLNDVPVAMFTGKSLALDQIDKDSLENLVDYIEKPFKCQEFLEAVERLLKKMREVYFLKEKIIESMEGNEELAEAFLAWSRTKMIHERLLEKLRKLKEKCVVEKKISYFESLISKERQLVEDSEAKKMEILEVAGIENPIYVSVHADK